MANPVFDMKIQLAYVTHFIIGNAIFLLVLPISNWKSHFLIQTTISEALQFIIGISNFLLDYPICEWYFQPFFAKSEYISLAFTILSSVELNSCKSEHVVLVAVLHASCCAPRNFIVKPDFTKDTNIILNVITDLADITHPAVTSSAILNPITDSAAISAAIGHVFISERP